MLLQFSLSADTLRTILLESVGYQKTESRNPVFSTLLVNWLEEAFLITKLQLQQSSIACIALLLAIQDRPEKYARTRYGQFFSDIPREKLVGFNGWFAGGSSVCHVSFWCRVLCSSSPKATPSWQEMES